MLDDLEADIAAAIKGEAAPAPFETVEATPVVETEAAPPENETAEERQIRVDEAGRARDKTGKFASKDGKPPAVEPAAIDAKTETPEAPAGAKHKPHTHWSPEMKATFLELPEAVQKAWLDREADMEKGRQEWGTKAEDFNKLNRVIEPMKGRWAMQGLTPDVAIGQLVSAANLLQNNPREGFEHLLKTYAGANYLHLINEIAMKNGYALARSDNQGQQPTEGQQPAMADPTVRRLEEQLQELKQWKQQYEERETTTVRTNMAAEVDAVRNKPENLFFENVKHDVAVMAKQMLDQGDKRPTREIVQDAYDRAVWANPTTRALQLQADQKARDAAARTAAAKQVETAKKAAVSVTGSPDRGAPAARPATSSKNRLDDIEADVRASLSAGRA